MRRDSNRMTGNHLWNVYSWYCPNCGNKCTGIRDGKGEIRINCNKCGAQMRRIVLSRRHDRFEVFAPEGEEHPEELVRREKMDVFYPDSESDC